MTKRVLQIGMTKNIGGIENYLISQYNFLNKEKVMYDFVNITGEDSMVYTDYLIKQGSSVYSIISRHKNPLLHYLQWLKLLLDKRGIYSAIVLNSNGLTYVYPLIMGKLFNIPVRIIHSHNSNFPFRNTFFRKILIGFNKFLLKHSATDYWACSQLAGEWMFGKNKSFQIIHNAIDVKKYTYDSTKSNQIRENFRLDDKFIIGHVGSFNYQKNHEFLIDIFDNVVKMQPDSILLLIGGDGGNPSILNLVKKKVNELGLADKVLFLGMRKDVPDLMQGMDCFVFPSRYEGLPLVGIEAQAAGLNCFFSSSITKELGITSLAHYVPLESSPEQWAENIIATCKGVKRKNMEKEISSAGYDIQCEISKIEDFYYKHSKC